MKKRLLTVPALGALLAFGVVACSGSSDNTAQLDTWAKSVCDSVQDPIAQSRVALADTGKVQPAEAPADLQKRLSADLAALAKSNQQLADAIDKAGAPGVDNGAQIQKDAGGELRQAAQGYSDAQKKLDALANSDQAKFADGLRSVGDQVQRLSQLSTQALNGLQSGQLGAAIKKQPGCKADAAASSASPAGASSAGASSPGAPSAAASSAGATAAPSSGAAASPSGSAPAAAPASPSASPKASHS